MKSYFFFIDDNIWVFRDLATQKPVSLFDNAYLGFLKKMHDLYDIKVQLNIFFGTSARHNGPYFDLSLMPDTWRDEWRANSDWLRLAFHAEREFPDYPYVNATYDEMANAYDRAINNVIRFAGEEVVSKQLVIHWLPVTREGCRALMDRGINALGASYGFDAPPYAETLLSDEHKERLHLEHTEATSCVYFKNASGGVIQPSLRAYNHMPQEQADIHEHARTFYTDNDLELPFKRLAHIVLNLHSPEDIVKLLSPMLGTDFIGIGNHEQYFYSDYFAYEPDYCDRIETAMKLMHDNGYKAIFIDELL